MIINIFSDVHLGVSRKAHTTAASSQELNRRIYHTGLNCIRGGTNIIAGDLFDKTYNPESVTLQGMMFASLCIVLSGNHDETNNSLTASSMDILRAAYPGRIVHTRVGEVAVGERVNGIAVVPHHSSQELFLQAIEQAKGDYLMVHCNRGVFPGETASSTLYITDELEDELLKRFKRIFYGHIHKPGLYKDGRVCVLGNVHPTSFGDISNKYRWELNVDTDELTQHLIWSKERYISIPLGGEIPDLTDIDFVDVTGKGSRRDTSLFVEEIWKKGKGLLAVRPNVEFVSAEGREIQEVNLENLSDVIEAELQGTDLLGIYKELRREIN